MKMVLRRQFLGSAWAAVLMGQAVKDEPGRPAAGRFLRQWWYERGVEHGNPFFNRRFRVNAPEAVLHKSFGGRSETRSSGMMQILAEDDPRVIESVDLYLELWGGHGGTANKRVTLNGRTSYEIPEVGTAAGHCTHQYPVIRLKNSDIVNGYNALQFACDQGTTFWGHFIVDNACLRAQLPAGHEALKAAKLDGFSASVEAAAGPDSAVIRFRPNMADRIARVDFQAYYDGYDENGNTLGRDWHGFTKEREPVAWFGSATQPPFEVKWDTSMLPAQEDVGVRARVCFKEAPALVYETAAAGGFRIGQGRPSEVKLCGATVFPEHFTSRIKRKKTAVIELPVSPSRIERAVLHTITWDGGRGTVEDYFTLNGKGLPVAGEGNHDVIYTTLPVEPGLLKQGANTIDLLSDTEHHGIEVLLPGPALMVRLKA
jgi:hypothetical protein